MQINIQDSRKAVTAEDTEGKAQRAQGICALRSFLLEFSIFRMPAPYSDPVFL
jgi:hypothetical protein